MSETYTEVSTPHVWRNPSLLWCILCVFYAVGIALFGVLACAEGYALGVVRGWVSITANDAATLTQATIALSSMVLPVVVVCMIVTLLLTYRLVANAHAQRPETKLTGPVLSVGAYFVPLLNLFMPPLIMAELWRASFGAEGRSPNGLIALWWGALIVSTLSNAFATYAAPESWLDPFQAGRLYGASFLSFLSRTIAASALLIIFGSIITRQRAMQAHPSGSV